MGLSLDLGSPKEELQVWTRLDSREKLLPMWVSLDGMYSMHRSSDVDRC